MSSIINNVCAREILDSRGTPTVEVTVTTQDGISGVASVPSGASTGEYEAYELRDDEKRYMGKGVLKAVNNVNSGISDKISGIDIFNQKEIDRILIESDGTENKSKYGANAILGVSLAVARAASNTLKLPLYKYIGGVNSHKIPVPMMNILNGGAHAENTVDFQEFMIACPKAGSIQNAMEMSVRIYYELKKLLNDRGYSNGIGDEGGFAPNLSGTDETLSFIMMAIEKAGFKPGEEVKIALDAAASELYDHNEGLYFFPGESRMAGRSIYRNSEEMVQYYEELVEQFPIYSIEDGLNEEDMKGWKVLTYRLGDKIQLVGDDLFVTNTKRLKKGIEDGIGNAILIKMNQIGTLTETIQAVEMAKRAGYGTIISHRSGETEDTTIADLCVALNAGQIKTGAPCRSDRTAKYNRLLKIEEMLNKMGTFSNKLE